MKLNKKAWLVIGSFSSLMIVGAIGLSSFDDSVEGNPNSSNLELAVTESEIADLADKQANEHFNIIDADKYQIVTDKVKPNEFLSSILQRHQIDLGTISKLADNAKNVFDVRRISAGNGYTLFLNDSGKAEYFVYQPNKIDYVVYKLHGDLDVQKGKKEVTSTIKTVAGTIKQSLYQALDEQNVNPDMANKLAEIFGWTVNFYGIQKGDWFKIEYEQLEVDGETVGSGKVLAAEFGHHGKAYEAYYFETEEGKPGTYYDQDGKSLRRAFLKAPIKYSRISSRFSPRRLHPVQKVWKAHLGTDFAAPTGTPIMATGDGIVVASTYAGGNGNYVKIQHDNVYATQYLHMSKRAVKRGDRVKQGQVIGYVGSTGLATGPHVCYRFWKNGKQVDALKQEFPSAEPIAEEHRLAFNRIVHLQRARLANVNPFEAETTPISLVDRYAFNIENLFQVTAEGEKLEAQDEDLSAGMTAPLSSIRRL